MAEDNQKIPLSSAKFNPRSDEEYATAKPRARNQEKSANKCFVYIFTAIVMFCAVILVFALVFMRDRTPELRLNSVVVKNLVHGNPTFPSFNVTLVAVLAIKNTNFGRFKYDNTSASVIYGGGGMVVGEAKLDGGLVKARDSERLNVTLDATSDRLPEDAKGNLTSDIKSGILKLSCYAELRGKVHLMNTVERKTSPVMNCTLNLNFISWAIETLICN